jgi:hypothetical protein
VFPEPFHDHPGHYQRSLTPLCLRRYKGQLAPDSLQLVTNAERSGLEVDVLPAKPQRLPLAQAERKRYRKECLKAMATDCGEEIPCLVWSEGTDWFPLDTWPFNEPSDVSGHHVPAHRQRGRVLDTPGTLDTPTWTDYIGGVPTTSRGTVVNVCN